MSLTPITPPSTEPVLLDEARSQCRVDDYDSDGQLAGLILSAREWAQDFTGRVIVTQTWEMSLDTFPSVIDLPLAPVQSITSIKYTDPAGAEQTLDPSAYEADLLSQPARIRPVDAWPSIDDAYNAVRVRFVVGYAPEHPDWHRFRTAILLHVEAHYDRDPTTMPILIAAAENMLWPLRRWMC